MFFPGQVVMPDELEMLARVCRTACKEEALPLDSRQAQTLASHVLKQPPLKNGFVSLGSESAASGIMEQVHAP
ncbi:hypothetical protein [Mesorhizobium sp. WSM3626]|uniref:hypothetical protein n=1 Tax=Mesorhizobium sp. WSM3626 TaxID=1040987 RepID=UPI0004887B65|nr:hypothetical protein [Mesorhizobium sp. WSM3626]